MERDRQRNLNNVPVRPQQYVFMILYNAVLMHFYLDGPTFQGYDFPVISDNFSDTYMMRVILVTGDYADRASACKNSHGDTNLTHI
jgi:hypothetical protein